MNELLPRLLSFPPYPPTPQPILDVSYDAHIRDLLSVLNGTPASLLRGVVSGGDALLSVCAISPYNSFESS
jgi:COP9 signalosome complex subunit 3